MRIGVVGANSGRTASAALSALLRAGHSLSVLSSDPAQLPDFGPSAKARIVPGRPWDEAALRDFILRECLCLGRGGGDWPPRVAGTPEREKAADAVVVLVSHAEPHGPPPDIVERTLSIVLKLVAEGCGCTFGDPEEEGATQEDASATPPGVARDGISDLFGRPDDDRADGDGPSFAEKIREEERTASAAPEAALAGGGATGLALSTSASAAASRRRRKAGDPAPSTNPTPDQDDDKDPRGTDRPSTPTRPRKPAQASSPASSPPGTPTPSGPPATLVSYTTHPPRLIFLLPPGTQPPGPPAPRDASLVSRLFSGEDRVRGDAARAMRVAASSPARGLGVFLRPAERIVDAGGRRTDAVAGRDGKAGQASVDRAGLVAFVVRCAEGGEEWGKWRGAWPVVLSE